ncbi:hypothetical protein D9756_009834 [Leucocoprinus leucothites]|uniref:Uncharacterized protein n=1 Tax=Leucocoprinus leucothites TaxID=201217 RepID=A0A8H5CW03_9AGAR|nr:hypothetical protein D9756_009834 [Leucoagaricus leucothites]
MTDPSTTKHPTKHDSFFSLPLLYALIIGINTYLDPRYPSLQSASKDADDFNDYLTSKLHVPGHHIINLRDTDATRDTILNGFEDLKNLLLIPLLLLLPSAMMVVV